MENIKLLIKAKLPFVKNAILKCMHFFYRVLDTMARLVPCKLPTLQKAKEVISNSGYVEGKADEVVPSLLPNTKHLSIIIPVYNSEKYLKKCLLSLLNQDTDIDYEIVCVNDGSNDGSLQILEKMKNEYGDKIVVYSQENGGISRARNQGIALAKGKYVGFVDNDDTVSPKYVNSIMKMALAYHADLVQAGYQRVRTDGSIIYQYKVPETNVMTNDGTAEFLSNISGFIWTGVYRKSLFNKIRFNVGYWYEDMITKFILGRLAHKVVVLNECLYNYTLHDCNSSDTLWKNSSVKSLDQLYLPIELFLLSYSRLHLPVDEQLRFLLVHELCWQLPNRMRGLNVKLQKAAFVVARDFLTSNHIAFFEKKNSYNKLSEAILQGDFNRWRYLAYAECYKSKIS